MAKKKAGGGKEPTFEEAMSRLEGIVGELEEAELPLEKSLVMFEEGVRLSRLLNGKLNEAEEKVEVLLREGGAGKVPRPFTPGSEPGAGAGEVSEEVSTEGEGDDDGDEDQEGLPF